MLIAFATRRSYESLLRERMRGFRAKIINRSYKPPPRVGWLWFVDQWSAIGTETGADLLVFCIKYVRNIWAPMEATSEKFAKNQVIGPLDSVVKFGKNCGLKLVNPEVIVLGFSSNSSIGWRFYSVTCAGWKWTDSSHWDFVVFPFKTSGK